MLVIQIRNNHRGRYVEVSSNPRKGKGCRILILEDVNGLAWLNMLITLEMNFTIADRFQPP